MPRVTFYIAAQPSVFLSYIGVIVSEHLTLTTPSIDNQFATVKERAVEGPWRHLRNYLRSIRNELKLLEIVPLEFN